MSTIKDRFDELNAKQEARTKETIKEDNNCNCAETPEEAVDLFDKDWDSFTISGVPVVEFFFKILEEMMYEFNSQPHKHDEGIVFEFDEVFERAGMKDPSGFNGMMNWLQGNPLPTVESSLLDNEKEMFKMIDSQGLGWKYYCMQRALAMFEEFHPDYYTETNEKYIPSYNEFTKTFENLTNNAWMSSIIKTSGLDWNDEIKKESFRQTVENFVSKFEGCIFPYTDDEIKEDNKECECEDDCNCKCKEEPTISTSSRVVKPQIEAPIETFSKLIDVFNSIMR